MRAPHDDDGRPVPYNAALCRATARMRRRMAEMAARIDELEAQLECERIAITSERRALTATLEGPEAQLAGLELAQSLLRGEAIEASRTHQRCGSCGGMGGGFVNGLLVETIRTHCETHGLEARSRTLDPMTEADWPYAAAGRRHHAGKLLLTTWHKPDTAARSDPDAAPWRPPHWQPEPYRNPRDVGVYY